MFEAPPAQIPEFSEKTFRCLFLLQMITFEPTRGSGVSGKRFFTGVAFVGVDLLILSCIDSWTNEYSAPRFRILRAQG